MKGYWIARVDVNDPEGYGEYAKIATEAVEEFGGRFLARGGKFLSKEGTNRQRNVIVEFPSLERANSCYNSATYKRALALAHKSAEREFIILEGA